MSQKGQIQIILIGILILAGVAGGAYYFGKSQAPKSKNPVVTSTSPTPDASPAPTGAEETANWKTYTNTQYSYSISYPDSWEVREAKPRVGNSTVWSGEILDQQLKEVQKVSFINRSRGNQGSLTVGIRSNPDNYDLNQWFIKNKRVGEKIKGDTKLSDIPAKNVSHFTYVYPGDLGIIALYKGNIYEIMMTLADIDTSLPPEDTPLDLIEQRKIFDRMLSTFKFLK